MDLGMELSNELFENVTPFQAAADRKVLTAENLIDMTGEWPKTLIGVVDSWNGRIQQLENTGWPIKPESVNKDFMNKLSEAYKTLAVIDLEVHGLKRSTAEKLVAAIID